MSEHNGQRQTTDHAPSPSYGAQAGPRTTDWLTPLQFARRVHLSRDTVYRRIKQGDIPQALIEYAGPRKILIDAAAVDLFKRLWKERRAGEWLSPEQFAQALGIPLETLQREIELTDFPPHAIEAAGDKFLLHTSALELFEDPGSR